MLCLKPYVLYKEHQKILGQGYQGVGDAPRTSTTHEMEDEEEGNGNVVAQQMDEEHVSNTSRARRSLGTPYRVDWVSFVLFHSLSKWET